MTRDREQQILRLMRDVRAYWRMRDEGEAQGFMDAVAELHELRQERREA